MISSGKLPAKQLVVLSGKGGTGKTSITAALVHLSSTSNNKCVFVDADVDAANLALVTSAEHLESHKFISSKLAQIDPMLCNNCNLCYQVCRYDAIKLPSEDKRSYEVIDLLCDGCASCVYSCPQKAIQMVEQQDGEWFFSNSSYGPLFHAELFPAADNSGKLVTLIKQHAKQFAENDDRFPIIIVDGPPGIGCPVISASSGADLALLVAEPGLSGMHDLQRVIKTLAHFNVPVVICINKADLYQKGTQEIKNYAHENRIEVIAEIPFDSTIPKAMVEGLPITAYKTESKSAKEIRKIWHKVQEILFENL